MDTRDSQKDLENGSKRELWVNIVTILVEMLGAVLFVVGVWYFVQK
jgi:hypothetical protein